MSPTVDKSKSVDIENDDAVPEAVSDPNDLGAQQQRAPNQVVKPAVSSGQNDEFQDRPDDLVNVGKFPANGSSVSNESYGISVSEAFGIDERNLYKKDDDEALTRAVADLD